MWSGNRSQFRIRSNPPNFFKASRPYQMVALPLNVKEWHFYSSQFFPRITIQNLANPPSHDPWINLAIGSADAGFKVAGRIESSRIIFVHKSRRRLSE